MPTGETADLENEVYERFGLNVDMFARMGSIAEGTRRPFTVIPEELDVLVQGEDMRLCFSLPAGAYASVLVKELQSYAAADSVAKSALPEVVEHELPATIEIAPEQSSFAGAEPLITAYTQRSN